MDLAYFLKENKAEKQSRVYPATKSITDENGKPLEWVLKPISTKENDELRESAVKQNGQDYTFDTGLYVARLVAASVEQPNLYNAQLQDSYGVTCPEDLVREMVDLPGEYNALVQVVQELNGFVAIDEKVKQAKN